MPAWYADDELGFIRVSRDLTRRSSAQLVVVDLRGRESAADIQVDPTSIRAQDAETIGGYYLLRVATLFGTEILAVETDGSQHLILNMEWPVASTRSATARRDRVLVTSNDSDNLRIGPMIVLDESLEASVERNPGAVTAALDPSGRFVAAVEVENPGEHAVIHVTLWDTETGDARRLAELDIGVIGIVWTPDDQLIAWAPDEWQVVELER